MPEMFAVIPGHGNVSVVAGTATCGERTYCMAAHFSTTVYCCCCYLGRESVLCGCFLQYCLVLPLLLGERESTVWLLFLQYCQVLPLLLGERVYCMAALSPLLSSVATVTWGERSTVWLLFLHYQVLPPLLGERECTACLLFLRYCPV